MVAGTPPTTSPLTTAVPLPVGLTPSLVASDVALNVSMTTWPAAMLMPWTLTSTAVLAFSDDCNDLVVDDDAAMLRIAGMTRAPTSATASALSDEPKADIRMPGMALSVDGPVYSWASARIG